jgi:hypothetical protein
MSAIRFATNGLIDFYGTTAAGRANGGGEVFAVSCPERKRLHSFGSPRDGLLPESGPDLRQPRPLQDRVLRLRRQ